MNYRGLPLGDVLALSFFPFVCHALRLKEEHSSNVIIGRREILKPRNKPFTVSSGWE
jgi:hypothetical protein